MTRYTRIEGQARRGKDERFLFRKGSMELHQLKAV